MPEVNVHTTEATPNEPLKTAEIAKALRVSQRTVRRWITVYGLPATPAGRAWRVNPTELAAWLATHPLRKK